MNRQIILVTIFLSFAVGVKADGPVMMPGGGSGGSATQSSSGGLMAKGGHCHTDNVGLIENVDPQIFSYNASVLIIYPENMCGEFLTPENINARGELVVHHAPHKNWSHAYLQVNGRKTHDNINADHLGPNLGVLEPVQ